MGLLDALLRVPADTSTLLHGLLSFGIYLLLFGSLARARLTTADVTSCNALRSRTPSQQDNPRHDDLQCTRADRQIRRLLASHVARRNLTVDVRCLGAYDIS